MVSDKKIFEISANENTLWTLGSHVGIQISTKNTNLVEDHPMNIYGKFGWNLFNGFREEELNQMWKANGRTDAYPWQKLTWPMARWAKKNNKRRITNRSQLPNLKKITIFFRDCKIKFGLVNFHVLLAHASWLVALKHFAKTADHHDITQILLKVALNTITVTLIIKQYK